MVRSWYVVVWDGTEVADVVFWDDWIRIPIPERPTETHMLMAVDHLDAFNLATFNPESAWHMPWPNEKGANQ